MSGDQEGDSAAVLAVWLPRTELNSNVTTLQRDDWKKWVFYNRTDKPAEWLLDGLRSYSNAAILQGEVAAAVIQTSKSVKAIKVDKVASGEQVVFLR